jgi:hypothetical protein
MVQGPERWEQPYTESQSQTTSGVGPGSTGADNLESAVPDEEQVDFSGQQNPQQLLTSANKMTKLLFLQLCSNYASLVADRCPW